jgi:hypothetical protein
MSVQIQELDVVPRPPAPPAQPPPPAGEQPQAPQPELLHQMAQMLALNRSRHLRLHAD